MEGARKRKRAAGNGEPKTCGDRPKQGQEATAPPSPETKDDDDSVSAPPPSEAEVEEFYAILRRMRTAVKYFNGVRDRRESGREAIRGGGGGLQLDLNSVPESENNGKRP